MPISVGPTLASVHRLDEDRGLPKDEDNYAIRLMDGPKSTD